jgi:hypothetical protein
MYKILKIFLLSFVLAQTAFAQQKTNPGPPITPPTTLPTSDSVLVTIFLKHQQDKNLTEIRRILESQGFWDLFPPKEARIVSWQIAIGLGHIIVLNMPANNVRKLHLAVQNGAWGAYSSEIFLTYDYKPIWNDYIQRRQETIQDRN